MGNKHCNGCTKIFEFEMLKRLLHRICSRPRLISSQISNLRRFYCKDHSNYIDEQYFSTIKTDFDRNLSVNLPQKSAIENVELQPLDLLENKKDFNLIDEQFFKGTQKVSQHINIQPKNCLDENDEDELNFIDQQFFGDHVNHNQSIYSTDEDNTIAT